ncbi:MAG: hypothetical protein AB7E36_15835 [Salinivirgaceae bacterium]
MKHIFFIFSIVFTLSCSNSNTKTTKNTTEATEKSLEKIVTTDTSLIISENAVIFLFPNEQEIEKMQKETPEDEYSEIIADMMWYPGIAGEILDSLKINNLHCDKDFIILKGLNDKKTIIERNKIEGNMIVFNIKKEPMISYAINFEKDSILNFLTK